MSVKQTRASGVLMPISSLWGGDSIGSFGREAYEFIDFLADSGFTWWQVLPFGMVDEFNSPYQSYSAFGGNPYFVDLRTLVAEGYLTEEEIAAVRQETAYVCEYDKLAATRMPLLRLAATRARAEEREAIRGWVESKPYIAQFCEFMARRYANGETPWCDWTTDAIDEVEHFAWQFIQYHFEMQWKAVRAYANTRGIRVMGDIPIYVSYDSCDVWANPEQFQLGKDGKPSAVAGCPPDAFNDEGQLWGNPLYDWKKMKEQDFAWWCDRVRHMLDLFDGVRIDHFRGLEAYWSIPAGATTARVGRWVKGPGLPFVKAIRRVVSEYEAAHGTTPLIVAEDLGFATPSLRKFLDASGFPGMRILQFAFDGDPENVNLPHNYPENSVVYTGTHDNVTILGFLWETDDAQRSRALEYCGYTDWNWDRPEAHESLNRALLRSKADLAILPIQDILGFGADCRINTPGTAEGNWRYRVTGEQMASINRQKYYRMNDLYGRLPRKEVPSEK